METPENLQEFAKDQFRELIKNTPENFKLGNELKLGIMYYDSEGKPLKTIDICTVNKDEL